MSDNPVISKQPTNEAKNAGEHTQFIIDATNYTEVTWYIITSSGDEIDAEDLNKFYSPSYTAGYDTLTLSVCSVQETMNGMKFYAHLVGKNGSVDSEAATLTVNTTNDTSTSTSNTTTSTSTSNSIIYVTGSYTPPSTIPYEPNYVTIRQGLCSSNFYCNGTLITSSNSITLPSTSIFTITNESKTNCSVSVATSSGVVYSGTGTQHTFYIDPNISGSVSVNIS